MTGLVIQELQVGAVYPRPDARPRNADTVRGLAESMAEIGQLSPIRVRPSKRYVSGVETDVHEVVAGHHRHDAARSLNWETIAAIVGDEDDLHAELATIDENLCRAELSATERATQTARRKAIYEELHPETKHGGDRKGDQVDKLSTRSFAADQAAATGKDERSVRREAERGSKVCDEAKAIISGTRLDTGAYLDKLKKVSPDEQVSVAQKALSDLDRQQANRTTRDQADKEQRETDKAIEDRDAAEFATWIAARIDLDEIEFFNERVARIPGKKIAAALRRLDA